MIPTHVSFVYNPVGATSSLHRKRRKASSFNFERAENVCWKLLQLIALYIYISLCCGHITCSRTQWSKQPMRRLLFLGQWECKAAGSLVPICPFDRVPPLTSKRHLTQLCPQLFFQLQESSLEKWGKAVVSTHSLDWSVKGETRIVILSFGLLVKYYIIYYINDATAAVIIDDIVCV